MTQPVPHWNQLPAYVKQDLKGPEAGDVVKLNLGFDEESFEKLSDEQRLTILNLYVKLSGMDLWKYVCWPQEVSKGRFVFSAQDLSGLKRELTERWEFRSPEDSSDKWDSAEKRASAALHLKHFSGWSETVVEAHIDQAGNWLGDPIFWWAGQPVTGIRHLANYDSYQDVFGIRELLLSQGWDPAPLLGVSGWTCGARDCPTHNRPEHRCEMGVWVCGSLAPLCPGHSDPGHYCVGGTWFCGAQNCHRKHPNREEQCLTGIWYCGRVNPYCPGHSSAEHRCETGAVLLRR